jgi:membrane protease YdiL (CAAX protease family)
MKKLSRRDRISVILVAIYLILGTAHNYIRTHLSSLTIQWISSLLGLIMVAVLIGWVVWSVWRWGRSVRDWCFTIDRKIWISLILLGIVVVEQYGQIPVIFAYGDYRGLIATVTAGMEELIFRVYLLFLFIRLFGGGKKGVILGVLASTVLFTIVHIPSKDWTGLIGIFISSFIMAFIVYWTRSVLFPVFYHVLSNTAGTMGFAGASLAVVLYFIIAIAGRPRLESD